MRHDGPPDPWRPFLQDLDAHLNQHTRLHCIGGFAAVHAYGLQRTTADIDVISVVPFGSSVHLMKVAGQGSALHRRHGVYLDIVTVASVPENYQERLRPIFPGCWNHLHLFVLDPYDLALTKLERNFERDRSDVAFLACSQRLDAATLRERYITEMQPYVIGRQSWHDQTLEMWIEAFFTNSQ